MLFRAAFLISLFVSSAAPAAIVSGTVSGGTAAADGTFVKLSSATPFVVGADNFQTDNLYGFDEQQNVTLTADLYLDAGQSVIKAGTVISSHFIVFDPLDTKSISGSIEFAQPILGFERTDASLVATTFLGASNVTYKNVAALGLEAGLDFVSLPATKTVLRINFLQAETPGDAIRVITAGTAPAAVPEIGSWAMMLCGFGLAGSALRRGNRSKVPRTA